MLGSCQRVALLALILVLVTGCGDQQSGASRKVGPNVTAQRFVEGITAGDPAALVEVTVSPLSDFYQALDDVRRGYSEVRSWLMGRYPGSSSEKLDSAAEQWRNPLSMFGELALEGLIEGSRTETSAMYRISYRRNGLRRCVEDLVVEKRDGRWGVKSYGADTPPEFLIGQVKSQATKLQFATKPGMNAVESVAPLTLDEAVELFWQQTPK